MFPPPGDQRGRSLAREPVPELDWRTYVSSVLRHKRLVGGMVALGLAAGIGAALLLKPTYSARANFWIEVPKDASGNPGPTWSSQILGSTAWMDLLRSDLIMVEAVRSQRLYLIPNTKTDAAALAGLQVKDEYRPGLYRLAVDPTGRTYSLTSDEATIALNGTVGDSIGGTLGFRWLPTSGVLAPGQVIEFEMLSLNAAVQKLNENLLTRPGRDRSFFSLEIRGSDPLVVTSTVNSMATRLVGLAGELKRQKLGELTRILGQQLSQAQTNLSRAEGELTEFRTRTATQRIEERDPAASGLLSMRVDQEQLRADREAITRVLAASVDSGVSIHALQTIGAVQRSPELLQALTDLTTRRAELRALQRRYTDANPAVQELAREVESIERGTIRSLARSLAAELTAQDARIAQRLQSTTRNLRDISPLPVEEARLSREVRVADELFVSLTERYEEARLAEVSVSPDVRLLDAATVPEKPLYNRAPLAIVLALMGSLGAGVVGAVVLDLVDPKVRYPAQVAQQLGLPLLGAVPHVARRSGKDQEGVAAVIEALRAVRFNVLHAHGAAGPLLLTVTSPGMGDGKSFITSNLALAFADARYRTLLVDGDIRRGALHRVMGVSRKPGLTDFLAGEAPADAIVQRTAYPELSFIGCGARRRSGPELLSSAAMARFIAGMRGSYDVILIDSSPLAAGIDPYALATLTGNLLLVLRTGVTDKQAAGTKLDMLGRLPIRILGSVINDVRPGDGYDQYAYYMAGYELEEEVAGGPRQVLPGGAAAGGPPPRPRPAR